MFHCVRTGAITAFKIISIAIASIVWAASCGHTLADLGPIMESNVAVIGLLYTGLITTAAALWVQSYAFEEVRKGKKEKIEIERDTFILHRKKTFFECLMHIPVLFRTQNTKNSFSSSCFMSQLLLY